MKAPVFRAHMTHDTHCPTLYSLELLILDQRLELGSSRDRHVERLGREERLEVEQVEVVAVDEVREQLVREAVQRRHDREGKVPLPVGGAVHKPAAREHGVLGVFVLTAWLVAHALQNQRIVRGWERNDQTQPKPEDTGVWPFQVPPEMLKYSRL